MQERRLMFAARRIHNFKGFTFVALLAAVVIIGPASAPPRVLAERPEASASFARNLKPHSSKTFFVDV
jgi:hypothetical protein